MTDERVKVTIQYGDEKPEVIEGRGVVAFVFEDRNEKISLSRCTSAAIGELSHEEVGDQILRLIGDDNEDQQGSFWREIITDVVLKVMAGEHPGTVTDEEAFAMEQIEEAEERADE